MALPLFSGSIPQIQSPLSGIAESTMPGIQTGLQMLAQHKLGQMQKQQELRFAQQQQQQQAANVSQGLGALGFTPQESQQLAMLPPQALNELVKQKLAAPQNTAYLQSLQGLLSGQQQGQPATQQPQMPTGLGTSGLNQMQATKLAELGLKKQELDISRQEKQKELQFKRQEREQENITKANLPYNKALDERLPIAQESKAIAQQMMDIWKTGKVATRLKGKYVPNVLQNQETIEFNRLSDELAKNLIAAMRGPATNFKIKFAQNLKPTSSQDPETQRKTIEHIMEMADRSLKEGEIRDQLVAQNKGIEPKQLAAQVRKAMKQQGLLGESKEGQYQEGQVLQDEDSGKYYHIVNGQPVEVSAERVARGS